MKARHSLVGLFAVIILVQESLIRLKQMYLPDISGYTIQLIEEFLTTGTLPQVAAATGTLTGYFYPLNANPLGYITSGQTGIFVTQNQLTSSSYAWLATVGANYYPNTNPSGFVTGNYYLANNPSGFINKLSFLTGNQILSGVLEIGPVILNTAQQTAFESTSPASVITMSGVPLIVRQGGGQTALYDSNGDSFLQSIYVSGGSTSTEFNYLTQMTVNSPSGTMGFITLDGTNDGRVILGTSADMNTLTVSGGNVGINNQSPQYPLDVSTIGTSLGQLTIETANVNLNPTGITPNGADIYINAGDGFLTSGGRIFLEAGADIFGYFPQSNILINTNGGKVGIGNTTPLATLDVGGSGNFSQGAFYNGIPFLTGITTGQTGKFLTYNTSSGLFYPYTGNPSGFITAGQTGIFVVTGRTGIFITTGQTGAFYPAVGNPSGFITTGQTGSFYPNNNPSGFLNQAAANALYASISLGNIVSTTGNQTISGLKTFVNNARMQEALFVDNIAPNSASVKLYDSGAFQSADFSARNLDNNSQNTTLDWQNQILTGTWNAGGLTISGNPVLTGKFLSGHIQYDVFSGESIDWNNRWLLFSGGANPYNYSLDWQHFQTFDYGNNPSIDWNARYLYDGSENITVDWSSRNLKTYGGGITLDWLNLILSGTWKAQGLTIGGYSVINSSQTGIFITTGQTGTFGGGSTPTGQLTGAFYPLVGNPSGYLTTGQTGNFYPKTNPSGFITGFNSGQYVLASNTGIFITTGQTGAFYSTSNPNSYISSFAVAANYTPLSSTGMFYSNANPSGFITSSQTGIFITTGQTGTFGGGGNTGVLSGVFYPLRANPSGFITGENLAIAISGATGNFLTNPLNVTVNGNAQKITGLKALGIGTNPSYNLHVIANSSNGDGALISTPGGWGGGNDVSIYLGDNGHYIRGVYSSSDVWYCYYGQQFQNHNGTNMTVGANGGNSTALGPNSPDGSAAFDIQSTSLGFLLPRLSPTQKMAISSPANGLMVFDTTSGISYYNGSWRNLIDNTQTGTLGGGGSTPTGNLTGVFYPLTGNPSGFVNSASTGNLTGAFYPLKTNPSGFLTNTLTGTVNGNSQSIVSVGKVGVNVASPFHDVEVAVGNSNSDGILVTTAGGWVGGNDVSVFLGATDHYIRGVYNSADVWSCYYGQQFQNHNGTTMTVGANGGAGVAMGSSAPDGSAALDVQSTSLGFLPPRLTSAQKNAISSPANGLIVFDTTSGLCLYSGGWLNIIDSSKTGNFASSNTSSLNTATGIASGTGIINWGLSNTFQYTLSGNTVFNFTGCNNGQTIVVGVINVNTSGFTGSYTATFPTGYPTLPLANTGVKWPNGYAPIQSAGATDIYTFVNLNNTIYGNVVKGF